MTCQCMLTSCNKCTTIGGGGVGESRHGGVGDMGNLYAFTQFCYGPTNALKREIKLFSLNA